MIIDIVGVYANAFAGHFYKAQNLFIVGLQSIIMVLESMINPKNAEDKPWHVFIIAIIYTFVAVFFANFLFPSQASILSIALVTIIFVPFFQRMFALEERKEFAEKRRHRNFLSRHGQMIYVLSAFFLGIIVAMSFIYMFFPSDNVFQLETDTIRGITTGNAAAEGNFGRFFFNNTQVMVLMFVLSVLFGAGAVFILSWNAAVIATYVGAIMKSFAAQGTGTAAAYLYGLPVGLGSITLHGIPEIVAYFIAGIGGGILSVGMLREKWKSREFGTILQDSILMFFCAEMLILIAALIEAA